MTRRLAAWLIVASIGLAGAFQADRWLTGSPHDSTGYVLPAIRHGAISFRTSREPLGDGLCAWLRIRFARVAWGASARFGADERLDRWASSQGALPLLGVSERDIAILGFRRLCLAQSSSEWVTFGAAGN
jgi:hypothetical protein